MHRRLPRTGAQAEESQHKVAETIEGDDCRPEEEQKQPDRSNDPKRRSLAVLQRQALRRQLAENDMQGGDDDEGDRDRERVRTGDGEPFRQAAQRRFDQVSKRWFSDPAERQRADRDAKLGRCKIGVEVVNGALERGSIGPAGVDKFRDPAATDRNKRELSRNEEAVRDDKNEYSEDADKIGHDAIGTRHDLLSGERRRHGVL